MNLKVFNIFSRLSNVQHTSEHHCPNSFFSHRSLDQGFQKNLAADEPNEETRPEVKNPNPGKRRLKKKDKDKDCT